MTADQHTVPAADRRRAASLLLALLDGGPDDVKTVLVEVDAAPAGVQGLISALALATLELLIGVVGVDNARATLDLQILNADADS